MFITIRKSIRSKLFNRNDSLVKKRKQNQIKTNKKSIEKYISTQNPKDTLKLLEKSGTGFVFLIYFNLFINLFLFLVVLVVFI